MEHAKPGGNSIIQPDSQNPLAPLSNRGKLGTLMHGGNYSHPKWFQETTILESLIESPLRVASVDMVRLGMKFEHHSKDHDADFSAWCDFFRKYGRADVFHAFESTKPAQYRWVFSMYFDVPCTVEVAENGTRKYKYNYSSPDACQITIGVGFNKPDGKCDLRSGFVEFNPNKTARHAYMLLNALQNRYNVRFEVVRWDYALDVQIERRTVVVTKDHRKYECHISNAQTTYLGARNTPGRVKVYDKTAESGLSEPWTRIEVTYARPRCKDAEICTPANDYWPMAGACVGATVVADADTRLLPAECFPPNTKNITRVTVSLASQLFMLGHDIEPQIQSIDDKRTRQKVRSLLVPKPFPFDLDSWLVCASHALDWEHPETFARFFEDME